MDPAHLIKLIFPGNHLTGAKPTLNQNKSLANAKRPCDCSVVWLMNIQYIVNAHNCAREAIVAPVPVGLAKCITAPLSHALACNGWSAVQAQPTLWVKIDAFHMERVTFGEYFGRKGTIPSNSRWSGKTRDIPVLYGVDILTYDYFILS